MGDLQARAKENQKKSIEVAHKNNPNNQKTNRLGSQDSNQLKPQNTI